MFFCRQRILINKTAALGTRLTNRFQSTLGARNVDYMPVINIPEKELAYNAFFSLHRPLLGLSGQEEFFAIKQSPEEALNDEIAEYMMQLEAFVPPSTTKN